MTGLLRAARLEALHLLADTSSYKNPYVRHCAELTDSSLSAWNITIKSRAEKKLCEYLSVDVPSPLSLPWVTFSGTTLLELVWDCGSERSGGRTNTRDPRIVGRAGELTESSPAMRTKFVRVRRKLTWRTISRTRILGWMRRYRFWDRSDGVRSARKGTGRTLQNVCRV